MKRVAVWTGLALALTVVVAGFFGLIEACCVMLGAMVAAVNLFGLHLITRYCGMIAADQKPSLGDSLFTFVVVAAKLPSLAFGFVLTRDLGDGPMRAFLAGFAVVYFAMLGWAQAKTSAHS